MTQPENNKKPKAITLAEWLETSPNTRDKQAAAELRRLHELNHELMEALTVITYIFKKIPIENIIDTSEKLHVDVIELMLESCIKTIIKAKKIA